MDNAELNRALEQIDIEQYLDRESVDFSHSYGTRGLQLNLAECPACGEGGRKTYINAETGLGNCFHGACGFKFNKFKLIQKVAGLAGAELDAHISAIAEEQGWMPKTKRKEITRGALSLPTKLRPIPEADGRHLAYLARRGVTEESAKFFNLTYCHGGWYKFMAEGVERYVSYDKRVVIPIADLDGVLVSFQGRDVTGTKLPKYLFPTGFAVAGSHIYNGQNFSEGVHTHLIVGEGAFDTIATHQALQGAASCRAMLAVATFGMHLSSGPDGQISKLLVLKERGVRTITMMWDSEPKALAASVKLGLQIAALGFNVLIAQLPAGCDPSQDQDGVPVPPEVVLHAIFNAKPLTRLSAIRLLHAAGTVSQP